MTANSELSNWLIGSGFQIRRRVRLLMLLDAADYAVISPVSTARLHAFAFLADVLSPIYELSALTGRVLKRRAGPYFPELQWELDRLVGLGLVQVSDLKAVVEVSDAYRDASFSLVREAASPILGLVQKDPALAKLRDFFRELASALGGVPDDDLDAAIREDVTWDTGHSGTVIDYAEWQARNYSELSAKRIEELTQESLGSGDLHLSPGAKVSLYVQYLRRAANG